MTDSQAMLVRYGAIPETARFVPGDASPCARGAAVVVETHRGTELGTVLERAPWNGNGTNGVDPADRPRVLRRATDADRQQFQQNRQDCAAAFEAWRDRIAGWELELELIDLEWMLDRTKLVLYVLNDRGADCTKLAIYAAAEGLGTVEVQPVTIDGLVRLDPPGGGCGSGGCGTCGV